MFKCPKKECGCSLVMIRASSTVVVSGVSVVCVKIEECSFVWEEEGCGMEMSQACFVCECKGDKMKVECGCCERVARSGRCGCCKGWGPHLFFVPPEILLCNSLELSFSFA